MKYPVLLLLFILITSCEKHKNHQETDKLVNLLSSCTSDEDKSLNRDVYVVMQLTGCATCVESMVHFTKQNIDNKRIGFIISTIGKVKATDAFTNQEIKKLFLDIGSKASKTKVLSGVASVYFMYKKNVELVVDIVPENVEKVHQNIHNYLKPKG